MAITYSAGEKRTVTITNQNNESPLNVISELRRRTTLLHIIGRPAMVEHKDGWTDCVSWDYRPKTLSEGLKILADWFDAVYDDDGVVQADLRTWAADYAELEAKLAVLVEAATESLKWLDDVCIESQECATEEGVAFFNKLKAAIAAAKVTP